MESGSTAGRLSGLSLEKNRAGADHWQQTLYAAFAAQVLCIMGFSSSLPFVPLFLIKDLHVHDAAEAGLWTGVMSASYAVVMALLSPLWGALADRFGRKLLVLRAMVGGSILLLMMAFTSEVWMLLVLRILQGALSGTVPASTALVAAAVPPQRLGRSLGLMQSAVYVGASMGPLVGGTLAELTGYRTTFFITALELALAAVIVTVFVHEDFKPVAKGHSRPGFFDQLGLVTARPCFLAMILTLVLVQFSDSCFAPIMGLYVRNLNGQAAGATVLAGLELAITGIASAFAAAVAGRLCDRLGHRRLMVICSLMVGLLYFSQSLAGDVWTLMVLRGLMGLFLGGLLPSTNALIAGIIPAELRGTAYGLAGGMTALGMGLGPVTGAWLSACFGTGWVFIFTGVIFLFIAGWVNRIHNRLATLDTEASPG